MKTLPRALFLMPVAARAAMASLDPGPIETGHTFPIVDSESTVEDLRTILAAGTPVIGLAGCRNGADIQRVATLLSVAEAQVERADGTTLILALTNGILPAPIAPDSLSGKSARLAALVWDRFALENALPTATPHTENGEWTVAFAAARGAVLLAAAAAGVPAYDCAIDLEGGALQRNCEISQDDGFYGRVSRNAAQAAIIEATYHRG